MSLNSLIRDQYKPWLNIRVNDTKIDGKVDISDSVDIVSKKEDLPTPTSDGVIILDSNETYILTKDIDLTGDRIHLSNGTALLGYNSENTTLNSTGLASDQPLLSSNDTVLLKYITFESNTMFNFVASDAYKIVDIERCNFNNSPNLGHICGYTGSVYMETNLFNNCGNLELKDTNTDITFVANGIYNSPSNTFLNVSSDATINNRLEFRDCTLNNLTSDGILIHLDPLATIDNESYRLFNNVFSPTGTNLSGVNYLNPKCEFKNNVNINNTAETGYMYMNNNTSDTIIGLTNTYYKITGPTNISSLSQKFAMPSDNTLVYTGKLLDPFKCDVNFSLSGNPNRDFDLALLKNSNIVSDSVISISTDGTGNFTGGSLSSLFQLKTSDYLETWIKNTTDDVDVLVSNYQFNIQKI